MRWGAVVLLFLAVVVIVVIVVVAVATVMMSRRCAVGLLDLESLGQLERRLLWGATDGAESRSWEKLQYLDLPVSAGQGICMIATLLGLGAQGSNHDRELQYSPDGGVNTLFRCFPCKRSSSPLGHELQLEALQSTLSRLHSEV